MALKDLVEFYLVRHGESEANVDKSLYTKIPDAKIELTQKGWDQAVATGKFLAGHFKEKGEARPIILRTSGLLRARQTTQAIYNQLTAAGFTVHVRESDMLTEQSLGQVAGRPMADWRQQHPDYASHFEMAKEHSVMHFIAPPGGEARLDAEVRVRADLSSVYRYRAEHGNGPVVMVNHGETNRQIAKVLLAQRHEESDAEPAFGNADVRLIARPPATALLNFGQGRLSQLINRLFGPSHSPHPLLDYGYIWKKGEAYPPVAQARVRTTDLFKANKYTRKPD